MSILVEKIARGNNSINDGDMMEYQYPPASIDDVNITTSSSSISIEFTWPNDTVLGGDTLVQVSEIVCLIKKGDIPYNTEDGYDDINTITSKDINSITFSGLEAETKYYIRFYVYGTNDECNNGGDMIYEVTTSKPVDPVFGNNSWEVINEIAESGTASDYWSVGDEITITLSDSEYFDFLYDTTITLQIWDFNHFDKSDESGKANICFGCKDIYIEAPMSEEEELIDLIYYSRSTMDEETTVNIYNSILEIVRNAIKEVTIEYNRPEKYTTNSMSAKVFIPSNTEVSGNGLLCTNYRYLYIGEQLAIFTDNASRIKNDMVRYGTGKPASWWTRTLFNTIYDPPDGSYMFVSEDGDINASYNQTHTIGAVFCFNI